MYVRGAVRDKLIARRYRLQDVQKILQSYTEHEVSMELAEIDYLLGDSDDRPGVLKPVR